MPSYEATVLLAQESDFTNTAGGKVFLAVVGALLSLAVTMFINRRNAKRERRLLTWSLKAESQALDVSNTISEKVEVRYSGQLVQDLTVVEFSVTNDGRQGIRDHQLRFPFPNGARVIEFLPQPSPEPEYAYEDISHAASFAVERTVKIGYLAPGNSISFLIVSTGDADWATWNGARSSNPTDDVEFERKDIARAAEDREHIRPFTYWAILLLFSPVVLNGLPGIYSVEILTSLAGAIIGILFLLFLLPHILPVSRVIENLVAAKSKEAERRGETISIGATRSVSIVTNAGPANFDGSNIYSPGGGSDSDK